MRCCIEWQSSAIPHKIGGKTPTRLWRHPDGWLAHRPLDHQRLDFGRQARAALLAASSKQLASPSGLSSWPPQYHAWSADTACIQQKLAPHLKGRTNCSYHLPSLANTTHVGAEVSVYRFSPLAASSRCPCLSSLLRSLGVCLSFLLCDSLQGRFFLTQVREMSSTVLSTSILGNGPAYCTSSVLVI